MNDPLEYFPKVEPVFPEAPLDRSQGVIRASPTQTPAPEYDYGSDLGIPSGLTPWMIVIIVLATRLKPVFQALASGVTDSQVSGKEFTRFLKEEFESARLERQEFLKSLNEVVSGFEAEREALLRSLDTLEEFVRTQTGVVIVKVTPHRRKPKKDYDIRTVHPDRPHRNKPDVSTPREPGI